MANNPYGYMSNVNNGNPYKYPMSSGDKPNADLSTMMQMGGAGGTVGGNPGSVSGSWNSPAPASYDLNAMRNNISSFANQYNQYNQEMDQKAQAYGGNQMSLGVAGGTRAANGQGTMSGVMGSNPGSVGGSWNSPMPTSYDTNAMRSDIAQFASQYNQQNQTMGQQAQAYGGNQMALGGAGGTRLGNAQTTMGMQMGSVPSSTGNNIQMQAGGTGGVSQPTSQYAYNPNSRSTQYDPYAVSGAGNPYGGGNAPTDLSTMMAAGGSGGTVSSSGGAQSANNPGVPITVPAAPAYGDLSKIMNPANWANTAVATQYQSYLDNTLPLQQLQQNQYQYGNDFNEGQRRWDLELLRQQGNDQYQQSLSDRQFNLSDWQAHTANQQWYDQFAQQKVNDTFSQNLATQQQQQAMQQQAWQQQYLGGQQQWNQNLQQQQQDLAVRQAGIEEAYRQGLITQQQAQNETERLNVQNQYNLGMTQNQTQLALGQQQNANTLLNYQNQYNLGMAQNQIQQQQNANQLQLGLGSNTNQANQIANQYALGQQSNANQLLNYQNQYNLGNRQLQTEQELNRGNLALGNNRFLLDQMLGQGNLGLAQQRLVQDAQLAAEQRATQEKIAALQASGRAQMPTARYIANW